jgi:hypothetical protein
LALLAVLLLVLLLLLLLLLRAETCSTACRGWSSTACTSGHRLLKAANVCVHSLLQSSCGK